jgi:hypothetical protein
MVKKYNFKLFHGQKYAENCVSEALKLRTSGKITIVEQYLFKKLQTCDCGSASFKLENCDCGLGKKLRVPTSVALTRLLPCPCILVEHF